MTNPETPTTQRRFLRPSIVALGLGVLLAAAAGIAWASGVGPAALGHGFCRAGHIKEFAEFRVHRMLKQVSATAAQEDQVLAILDAEFAKHQAMAGFRQELHQKIHTALMGETVDRAGLEAARAEAIQHLDTASKELTKAIADMADVLTPAQRKQLADLHSQHFE
jgi:Spy/CpxP family protein refolding chaperone